MRQKEGSIMRSKVFRTEVIEGKVLATIVVDTITKRVTMEVVPYRSLEWDQEIKGVVIDARIMGDMAPNAKYASRIIIRYEEPASAPFLHYIVEQDLAIIRADVRGALGIDERLLMAW